MSIRLMSEVWRMDLPATDKMVLLALADSANDDGITWLALKSRTAGKYDLTVKTSLSPRAIQLAIKRLCELGLLKRDERPGRGVVYTVLTPAPDAPPQEVRPAGNAPAPAPGAPKPSLPVNTGAKAPYERVVDHWNRVAKPNGFSEATVLDASRKQTIRLRIKSTGEDQLLLAIDRLAAAAWVKKRVREGEWKPDLDYFLRPATIRKLLEATFVEEAPAPRKLSGDECRDRDLANAAFYEKIGRHDEAAEIRRRWPATPSVGSVASKILERVTVQ